MIGLVSFVMVSLSNNEIMVECLVPDFRGNQDHVKTIALSGLDVFAHNVETVETLTPFVRDRRAHYRYVLIILCSQVETVKIALSVILFIMKPQQSITCCSEGCQRGKSRANH